MVKDPPEAIAQRAAEERNGYIRWLALRLCHGWVKGLSPVHPGRGPDCQQDL